MAEDLGRWEDGGDGFKRELMAGWLAGWKGGRDRCRCM